MNGHDSPLRSAALRPLSTSETLDAAVEIARRDLGLYGSLAVLSLGPLAVLAIRFVVARSAGPLTDAAHFSHALLLTLAVLWRYVVMGASAVALERHLAGQHPRLGSCLAAALRRGVSLAVTGALVVLTNVLLYFIFFANIWLGWISLCAIPLCAERSASSLGSLGASRRTLSGLGGKAAALNALYLLVALLMLLNTTLGLHILLMLGHVLLDVEIAWIQRFLSPANPVFLLVAVSVALTLLEPVRHLTCALLVWDSRIRREAHDIRAVFAALRLTRPTRGRRAVPESAGPAPAAPSQAGPPTAPAAPTQPSQPAVPAAPSQAGLPMAPAAPTQPSQPAMPAAAPLPSLPHQPSATGAAPVPHSQAAPSTTPPWYPSAPAPSQPSAPPAPTVAHLPGHPPAPATPAPATPAVATPVTAPGPSEPHSPSAARREPSPPASDPTGRGPTGLALLLVILGAASPSLAAPALVGAASPSLAAPALVGAASPSLAAPAPIPAELGPLPPTGGPTLTTLADSPADPGAAQPRTPRGSGLKLLGAAGPQPPRPAAAPGSATPRASAPGHPPARPAAPAPTAQRLPTQGPPAPDPTAQRSLTQRPPAPDPTAQRPPPQHPPGATGRRLAQVDYWAHFMAAPDDTPEPRNPHLLNRQLEKLSPLEQAKILRFVENGEAQLTRLQARPPSKSRREESRRLAQQCEHVVASLESLAQQPTPSHDLRATARTVLAQPEFHRRPEQQATPTKKKEEESWFDRLLRWLFKPRAQKRRVAGAAPGLGGAFFQALTMGVLIAGVLLILIQVILWLVRRRRSDEDERPPTPGEEVTEEGPLPDPTTRSPTQWLDDADAAAARGEYRIAMRALYLALLSALCHRGALRYDPARTNGEYVRLFRGAADERSIFRSVTLLSDAAIYGDFNPGGNDFAEARAMALRLAGAGEPP